MKKLFLFLLFVSLALPSLAHGGHNHGEAFLQIRDHVGDRYLLNDGESDVASILIKSVNKAKNGAKVKLEYRFVIDGVDGSEIVAKPTATYNDSEVLFFSFKANTATTIYYFDFQSPDSGENSGLRLSYLNEASEDRPIENKDFTIRLDDTQE